MNTKSTKLIKYKLYYVFINLLNIFVDWYIKFLFSLHTPIACFAWRLSNCILNKGSAIASFIKLSFSFSSAKAYSFKSFSIALANIPLCLGASFEYAVSPKGLLY